MESSVTEITVPFLVTKKKVNCPIIGYNVIQLFVKKIGAEKSLSAVIMSFNNTDARALVNFINGDVSELFRVVRTCKKQSLSQVVSQ